MTPEQFAAIEGADVILDAADLPTYFTLANRLDKLEGAARGTDPAALTVCLDDAAQAIARFGGVKVGVKVQQAGI